MIIILEGPDGAGKSYLAHQLMERFGLSYHHEGPPPKHISALEYYGAVLEELRGKNFVLDRYALGERVYGHLHRGVDGLGDEGWKLITRLIRSVGAIQVLCQPPYRVCHEAWSSGREEMVKEESIFRAIYDRYHALRHGQDFIYNYCDPTHYELLMKYIESEGNQPTLGRNMVGSPRARYLFVGERGSNGQSLHSLPFFATTGSSEYLNRALHEAGYEEHELALINAYDNSGTVQKLDHPTATTIIALGRAASVAVAAQGKNCWSVPHPQFWKRFHNKNFIGYVAQLRACRQQ